MTESAAPWTTLFPRTLEKGTFLVAWSFLFILAAVSTYGQTSFHRAYRSGGLSSDLNEGVDVEQTADGGYIVAGIQAHLGGGLRDYYLVRTNAHGDIIWTRSFGGTHDDYASDVEQTTDSGFMVIGYSSIAGAGETYPYAVKTAVNGDIEWTKAYTGPCLMTHGIWGEQTTDGGYIIGGGTCGAVLLLKTDANGDTLWSKALQHPEGCSSFSGQQTTDGGYLVCGELDMPSGQYILLIKTDPYGNAIWAKGYGGFYTIRGLCVQQTSDGGYVAAGHFLNGFTNFKSFLVRTSSTGDTLWTRIYGASDYPTAIEETADGGYFFAADNDLVKLDINGDVLWNKRLGGATGFSGRAAHQTSDSGFVCVGNTNSPERIQLIKTDPGGNSGCNAPAYPISILSEPISVITPSILSTPAHISVWSYPTVVDSGAVFDSLCSLVGINEAHIDRRAPVIFPNPSSGNFDVSYGLYVDRGSIAITDILGATVFEDSILNGSHNEISLKNVSSGIYLVSLRIGERVYVQKLMIQ